MKLPIILPAAAVVAVVAVTGCVPPGAASSVGAGIQVGPARFTAHPGGTARIRVTLANSGSGSETLTVYARRLDGTGPKVPRSWVHAGAITLAAGATGPVWVTVTVPPGTPPGRYTSDLGARFAPSAGQAPVSFGAAAFTNLIVHVR